MPQVGCWPTGSLGQAGSGLAGTNLGSGLASTSLAGINPAGSGLASTNLAGSSLLMSQQTVAPSAVLQQLACIVLTPPMPGSLAPGSLQATSVPMVPDPLPPGQAPPAVLDAHVAAAILLRSYSPEVMPTPIVCLPTTSPDLAPTTTSTATIAPGPWGPCRPLPAICAVSLAVPCQPSGIDWDAVFA